MSLRYFEQEYLYSLISFEVVLISRSPLLSLSPKQKTLIEGWFSTYRWHSTTINTSICFPQLHIHVVIVSPRNSFTKREYKENITIAVQIQDKDKKNRYLNA